MLTREVNKMTEQQDASHRPEKERDEYSVNTSECFLFYKKDVIVVYSLRYRVNTVSRHVLAVVLFGESQFTNRKSKLCHPTGDQVEQGLKLFSCE